MSNTHYASVRLALGAFTAIVAACGCDKGSGVAATGPATHPAATAPARRTAGLATTSSAAKPGFATGRVLRQDGQSIAIEGARIAIALRGVSDRTTQVVNYSPAVRPDGSYEAKVDDGTYRPPTGVVEVPFNGRHYRFELDPEPPSLGAVESRPGIRQDFVWRLSGPRRGFTPDETRAAAWHGGPIAMHYQADRPDLGRRLTPPPRGTRAVFTLTPAGPLADGRAGKPLTVERPFDDIGGLKNPLIPDVPLAIYSVTGAELRPDGDRRPLLFLRPGGREWGDSFEGTFQPNLDSGGVDPVDIPFTRREE